MAVTPRAQEELKKLLKFIPPDEILSLFQTVTNRQLSVTSKAEAIKAILTFSQNLENLLKRRKIRKTVIFQYLASENIVVDPNSEKHTLINKVLEYWGIDFSGDVFKDDYDAEETLINKSPGSSSQTRVSNNSNSGQSSNDNPSNNFGQTSKNEATDIQNEMYDFARQFCDWLYKMLNNCNPTNSSSDPNNRLTSVHFYTDCNMKLMYKTDCAAVEHFSGGDLICQRLRAFSSEELLLFNPNLDIDGISAEKSAHGLIVIHVCGTIHRRDEVLGLFEQRFGLIKDPSMDNNWRVKYTHLAMQASHAKTKPILGKMGALKNMLTDQ